MPSRLRPEPSAPVAVATQDTGVAGAALDPPAFRLLNEIGIIGQLSRSRFERVLPGWPTTARFGVLDHFVRLGGERSLVALARSFQLREPAMGKLVSITGAGHAMRAEAEAALAPEIARLQIEIGNPVFERLLPDLVRVRQWLDGKR